MDAHALIAYIGAIGLVIMISALLSGLVERGPFSQVLVFVALGVLAGPAALGIFHLDLDSPAIKAVSTISLVLVLFTDAVKVNLAQLRTRWLLPLVALGPGAILTAALISLAAYLVLGLPPLLALLVGAILSSTDAVLLRDVTRDHRVPLAVRHTLSIEAGLNDAVVLPATLLLAALTAGAVRSGAEWAAFVGGLLVVGPAVGVSIALLGIRALAWLRRHGLVRRDYESLYSLGMAFTAYAAAELVGGSGFLAAFSAGLTIASLDVSLCECFLEYGETTAEMAMLVTFLLLGGPLAAAALATLGPGSIVFTALVLLLARPAAFMITMLRARASWGGRAFIAWFGPRGLNSLLLTLLAIGAGVPQGAQLFGIVSLVVLVSIVVHGVSATPLAAWYARRQRANELPEETLADGGLLLAAGAAAGEARRIEPSVLRAHLESGDPVLILDVRRKGQYVMSGRRIPGAVRVEVDEIPERIAEIPRDRLIALYCT